MPTAGSGTEAPATLTRTGERVLRRRTMQALSRCRQSRSRLAQRHLRPGSHSLPAPHGPKAVSAQDRQYTRDLSGDLRTGAGEAQYGDCSPDRPNRIPACDPDVLVWIETMSLCWSRRPRSCLPHLKRLPWCRPLSARRAQADPGRRPGHDHAHGALRKEPNRRYASAEHFADDLNRYLEGLPVRAHRDSAVYRATKFVRRHRAAVAAGSALDPGPPGRRRRHHNRVDRGPPRA